MVSYKRMRVGTEIKIKKSKSIPKQQELQVFDEGEMHHETI